MAFTFKKIQGISTCDLAYKLENAFHKSRFKVGKIVAKGRNLEIGNVRLKQSKDYCGNHPFARLDRGVIFRIEN